MTEPTTPLTADVLTKLRIEIEKWSENDDRSGLKLIRTHAPALIAAAMENDQLRNRAAGLESRAEAEGLRSELDWEPEVVEGSANRLRNCNATLEAELSGWKQRAVASESTLEPCETCGVKSFNCECADKASQHIAALEAELATTKRHWSEDTRDIAAMEQERDAANAERCPKCGLGPMARPKSYVEKPPRNDDAEGIRGGPIHKTTDRTPFQGM